MLFEPIDKFENNQPSRYYEKIVENIRTMMCNGEISSGSKLPSERELAKMFNVSRVPVREAMKILEYLGVVINVPGEGMYIYNLDVTDLIDKLNFALDLSDDTISELFEIREVIEITSVKLAAQRRTESDILDMKNAIDTMNSNISNGTSVVNSSIDFHNAIIKATKNEVLYKLYANLNTFLKLSKEVTLSDINRLVEPLFYHKEILDKIIEKDADGAANIMHKHISNAKKSFTNNKKQMC